MEWLNTPTSTPPSLDDSGFGLIDFSSDQDGDFEIWVMSDDGDAIILRTDG